MHRGMVETGVRTALSTGGAVIVGAAAGGICGPVCRAGGGALGSLAGGTLGDLIF